MINASALGLDLTLLPDGLSLSNKGPVACATSPLSIYISLDALLPFLS
jgi:hypothetical protein